MSIFKKFLNRMSLTDTIGKENQLEEVKKRLKAERELIGKERTRISKDGKLRTMLDSRPQGILGSAAKAKSRGQKKSILSSSQLSNSSILSVLGKK